MPTTVLGVDDVDVYRTIRLDALRTDPAAFCSTHEREAAFDDATMATRMTSRDGREAAVIVDSRTRPNGVVGVGDTGTGAAELVGMWVRPEARASGLGGRLVEHAVAWATERGLSVVLWVVADNAPAIALYERFGFVRTGRSDVVPGRPREQQLEMQLTAT